MNALLRWIRSVNEAVARSILGRLFRLEGCGHEREIKHTKFTTELRAGLTTFFTMAYIIAVNASILSSSGGTCVCHDPDDQLCEQNAEYLTCVADLNASLVTTTAAISGFSSILFGLTTNMPVCLAPGMGLNAYFTYQVVGFHGSGLISYQLALTTVFLEGLVFIFLSLIGVRQWLMSILPSSLQIAAVCGLGLFLAEIGLSTSAGIGIISGARDTPLQIAGCAEQYLVDGVCISHRMTSPKMWLGIVAGGFLTAYLMMYRVKSAMMLGIMLVAIISWPRDTPFSYFSHTMVGDASWEYFKKVVNFHPITTLNVLDWNISAHTGHFVAALFTFLYVDILDCTATLYGMARFSGVVDSEGNFPRSTVAYCTDAFCISVGALLGTSPVTAFIESGAGVAEGGRTGLTAITCGFCFLVSMFFAPIFAAIPPWATGCTLIIVGCLMMRQIAAVNWRYIGDAVPAFVTMMFIPFSYSPAYGLIAGVLVYIVLNGLAYITKFLTCGRIAPSEEDHREYWTMKAPSRIAWFVAAAADRLPIGRHRKMAKDDGSLRNRVLDWRYQDQLTAHSHTYELKDVVVTQPSPTHQFLEKSEWDR